MNPNSYPLHWNLGFAYEMKGAFEDAITEYEQARQLNDDPWVLALLGHVSPDMTMRYASLASPTVRTAYDQAMGKARSRLTLSASRISRSTAGASRAISGLRT